MCQLRLSEPTATGMSDERAQSSGHNLGGASVNGRASRVVWDWRARDPERERERVALRLKREGLLQGLVVLLLGLAVKNVLGHRTLGDVLVVLGAVQGMVATWRPLWLRPVRRCGRGLGRAVGGGLTWLLLVPFFLLVMAPVALVLRLRGRDPLHRQPLPAGLTAWIPRRHAATRESLQRQFLVEDREARALARPEGAQPDPALLDDLEVRS